MDLQQILQMLEIDKHFYPRDLERPQRRFKADGSRWKDVRSELSEKLLGTEIALKEAKAQYELAQREMDGVCLERDNLIREAKRMVCQMRSELDEKTSELAEKAAAYGTHVELLTEQNGNLGQSIDKLMKERGWIYRIQDWFSQR